MCRYSALPAIGAVEGLCGGQSEAAGAGGGFVGGRRPSAPGRGRSAPRNPGDWIDLKLVPGAPECTEGLAVSVTEDHPAGRRWGDPPGPVRGLVRNARDLGEHRDGVCAGFTPIPGTPVGQLAEVRLRQMRTAEGDRDAVGAGRPQATGPVACLAPVMASGLSEPLPAPRPWTHTGTHQRPPRERDTPKHSRAGRTAHGPVTGRPATHPDMRMSDPAYGIRIGAVYCFCQIGDSP